jgi:hypothetical protein
VADRFHGTRAFPKTTDNHFLGRAVISAWLIVLALILTAVFGFGILRGYAPDRTEGHGILNPTHDAAMPSVGQLGSGLSRGSGDDH